MFVLVAVAGMCAVLAVAGWAVGVFEAAGRLVQEPTTTESDGSPSERTD